MFTLFCFFPSLSLWLSLSVFLSLSQVAVNPFADLADSDSEDDDDEESLRVGVSGRARGDFDAAVRARFMARVKAF